jgi:hypothetical protein
MQKVTVTGFNRNPEDPPVSEEEVMDALLPLGLSDIYVQIDDIEEDDDE